MAAHRLAFYVTHRQSKTPFSQKGSLRYTAMFRKKLPGPAWLCLLLLVVTLLLPGGMMAASALRGEISEGTPSNRLNFSDPTSEATVEWKASVFLAHLNQEAISDAEATYVDSMLVDAPFMYSSAIPSDCVETAYDQNTLRITAHTHVYTATNGETVVWMPASVTLNGTTHSLSHNPASDTYIVTLTDIPESTETQIEVNYTASVTIPASEGDLYRNYAYRYADRLCQEEEAYRARLAAYEAYQTYLTEKSAYDRAMEDYKTYLAAQEKYEQKLAAYMAYEQALADYRLKLAAYETYLTDLETYRTDLSAYEAAVTAHIQATDAYNAAIPLYEAYLTKLSVIQDCMTTFDTIFIRNSEGKQMYATLMGDTVATVVNRKNELVSAGGCDPQDIDTAAASTAALKSLLTSYRALKTPSEQFAFYQTHYAELRQNFISLYGSLRSLYDNDLVKTTLKSYDRLYRYIEFLSQLYVISSGLDDEQHRSEDWYVEGNYDPTRFDFIHHSHLTELEPIQRPEDRNNADPTGLVFPPEVAKPTPPAPLTVTRPTPPTEVICPLEPDAVQKPVEPSRMDKPIEPAVVKDPGERPIAPAYTALQKMLIAAYAAGTLYLRPEGNDTPLTLHTTLRRHLSLQNRRPVTFLDYDGQTILYSTALMDGEPIPLPSLVPTRSDTEKYTYRFAGWKDKNGTPVADLGVVDEPHETFYASYEVTLRRYTVTWRCDSMETAIDYAYGSLPAYTDTPVRAETAQYTYTFVGWSAPGSEGRYTELPPVVGDVTYEACFESILRQYDVTWVWGTGTDRHTDSWDYGAIPTLDRIPPRYEDDRFIYTFAGWDKTPATVTGDITYTARYDALPILSAEANNNPPVLALTDETYFASIPREGLWVTRLLELAEQRERAVVLTSPDGVSELWINEASVSDLREAGCVSIKILPTADDRYRIRFTNEKGADIALRYPLTLRYHGTTDTTRAYTVHLDGSLEARPFTYEDGTVTVKLSEGCELFFRREYALSLSPCEGGMLTADRTIAEEGEIVQLTLTFPEGFAIDTVRVIGNRTGMVYGVSKALTFAMPDEPITVTATLRRRTCTVTFLVDGVVISEMLYNHGDALRLPEAPVKIGTGTQVYTFNGWSPAVTEGSTVTGDVTYTATFKTSTRGDNNTYIPSDSKNREYRIFLIAGAVLAVLIAGPIVTTKLVRRRRRQTNRPRTCRPSRW